MRIHSDSFTALARIPGEYAFGIPGVDEPMALGANRNPHLAWDGVPDATRSFALSARSAPGVALTIVTSVVGGSDGSERQAIRSRTIAAS